MELLSELPEDWANKNRFHGRWSPVIVRKRLRTRARVVVSKILNHVETGVTAVYDRHSYDLEKRAALDFWGKRVDDIVRQRRGKLLRFSLSA